MAPPALATGAASARWIHDSPQDTKPPALAPASGLALDVLCGAARRTTFALTGLPPQPDDIDALVTGDPRNDFAGFIDRLLASPRFGEKWAAWWLDLTGYADSIPIAGPGSDEGATLELDQAWRYRDWVVRSFNEHMSLDRFVMLQLAGDLVSPSKGEARGSGLAASTFLIFANRLPAPHPALDFADEVAMQQTGRVSRLLLGSDLSCARCHEARWLPAGPRDYTAIAQAFRASHNLELDENTIVPNRITTAAPRNQRERTVQLAEIKKLEKRLNDLSDAAATEVAANFLPQTAEYVRAAWVWNRGLSGPLAPFCESRGLHLPALERWLKYLGLAVESSPPLPTPVWWAEWKAVAGTKDEEAVARVAAKIQAAHRADKSSPFYDPGATGFPMFTRDQQTRIRRLAQEIDDQQKRLPSLEEVHGVHDGGIPGIPHAPAPEPPTVPTFLAAVENADALSVDTRRDLAGWMIAGGRSVVARVLVNHIWGELFARGLVPDSAGWWGTPPPPHREILDSLAAELITSNWSLTAVLRRICMSKVWCDPTGLALDAETFVPRPMNASEFRDATLSVSGELDGRLHGASLRDAESTRRSLYLWRRAGEKTPAVGPAFLANRAVRLAELCREKAGAEPARQIDWLHQRLLAREPSLDERNAARAIIERESLTGLARRMIEGDAFRTMK